MQSKIPTIFYPQNMPALPVWVVTQSNFVLCTHSTHENCQVRSSRYISKMVPFFCDDFRKLDLSGW